MTIDIITSGLKTTVQDLGRAGYRHWGVPLSGAADARALALANYCAGNPAGFAGLEMTLNGPDIQILKPITFALGGAKIMARLNDKPLQNYKAYTAQAGDRLCCGVIRGGARSYLALNGGVKARSFLGSLSAYKLGRFGAFHGQALKVGDSLQIGPDAGAPQILPQAYIPQYSNALVLRALLAPEFSALNAASQTALLSKRFVAARETDRMGARLTGAPVKLRGAFQMSSSPILPGTVQIPPNGEPILMLADGHCIGGYPRALQIIRADRYLLGQIKPGTHIYFHKVTQEAATDILRAHQAIYQTLMPEFKV